MASALTHWARYIFPHSHSLSSRNHIRWFLSDQLSTETRGWMMCPVVRISTTYRMLTEWFSTSRLVFKNILNWIVPYKAVTKKWTRADAYSGQGGECESQICSTPKTEHVKSRRSGVQEPVVVRSMPRRLVENAVWALQRFRLCR
jgi:hypothetical protein